MAQTAAFPTPSFSPEPSASGKINGVRARAFDIPTESEEADGTISWKKTTLVLVELSACGKTGLGYTYGAKEAASIIRGKFAELLTGIEPMNTEAAFESLSSAVRNIGYPGIAAMAISAVDLALWDLKAKILGLSIAGLLGSVRDAAALYGSGGFTSYSDARLRDQLGRWADDGFKRVKMKVGSNPGSDVARVREARKAIGPEVELFVDANGAYSVKQALGFAEAFAGFGVKWFEEPVSSDDLGGLRDIRARAPAPMEIAAGEYGFDVAYFERMLAADSVDVIQADATRCGGITGFRRAIAIAEARHREISAHCAPSLHAALGCSASAVRHLEYFYDHARIERMLFEGIPAPEHGRLRPGAEPGFGMIFKESDAAKFAVPG
jgi:L-alanine-DL-glutamate epimerase-like enolase superfamily enzyme